MVQRVDCERNLELCIPLDKFLIGPLVVDGAI